MIQSNIKPVLLVLILAIFSVTARPQSVGVGTNTPHASAQLDVASTTKGMLIPRMTSVQRNAIPAPATGLLVFDTDSAKFIFYDGAAWSAIPSGPGNNGNSSWAVAGQNQFSALAGNVGIGTTAPAGKLHVKGTAVIDSARIIFQNTANSILIGQNAGAGDLFTSGGKNTFVGQNAGQAFTTGESNIAIGEDALQSANISVENIAIGKQALGSGNIIGIANVAIGSAAGFVNTGNGNVFMGQAAASTNTSGNDNVIIGHSAGAAPGPVNGSRNVFIGLNAGQNEFGSDKLYINSAVNPGPPLVYGDFFTRLFRINGTLNINNNYSLPATAGNNNFVLKSDGGGNTSWANVNSLVNTTWTTSGTNQYSSNTGNVGIGTATPGTKLDVAGTTRTTAFQLPTGATAGHILRSDASGNATWVNPNTVGINETDPQVAAAVTNRIPKWNGTALTDGIMYDDGVFIGISTATPQTKLDVNGTTRTAGFQMPTGAAAGHILRTDEFGNGTWINPNTLTVNETDPQVASATTSRVPRWNGTALTDGAIQDDAVNVGIGTAPLAANKLTVTGKTQADSIQTTRFQMTNGATNGYVLQSDAAGRASWVNANTLTVNYAETDPQVTAATVNKIPKWNGASLADGLIFDNGTNIGIGTVTPGDKLHITGNARIDGGRIEFANTGYVTAAGQGAGASDIHSNSAPGYNTFIGAFSGTGTSSGYFNTALGWDALRSNTSGFQNVAVGTGAMQNNDAAENVVIGHAALALATSAYFNVMIGSEAGSNNNGNGNVFIGYKAGRTETGSNKLIIANNENTPLIRGDFATDQVTLSGRLGVGTQTPTQAKLVVIGSASGNLGTYGYLNSSGNTGTSGGASNYSIYASSRIAASEFNAHSDARIKKIKGISNNKQDLQTLMNIEITDYKLIDSTEKGNRDYKKVIAQQVEKVYPQAVNKMTDVIPDIYKLCKTNGKDFIYCANPGLKAGEKVRLILNEGEKMAGVKTVTPAGFSVSFPLDGAEEVFVFGREVNDFCTVDYEALSTLNISATQALLQQVQAQMKRIEELEKEVRAMKGGGRALTVAGR